MYVLSQHFSEEPEQEVVCLFTNERYVHLEGNDKSIIEKKFLEGAVESLPSRFYKMPFIKRYDNGQVKVFGNID